MKKKIIMAVLSLVAVGLLAIKLGPLFMPRSWRIKRMAKKAGQPIPEIPKKKKPAKKTAPKPASQPSATQPEASKPAPEAPKPAVSFDISNIDERISDVNEIIMETYDSIDGKIKTPFMKYVPPKKEEEKPSIQISVSGILWDSKKPLAIINGEIYTVGEKVENTYVVEKIGHGFVLLSEGGKKIKVPVGE